MIPASLRQRCNACWEEVSGACYRTLRCRHLFCEQCAYKHYSSSSSCSLCETQLGDSDICELVVGVEPTVPFQDALYQQLYKDSNLSAVVESLQEIALAMQDSVAFVLTQLALDGRRTAANESDLQAELTKYKHENGRLSMQLRNSTASLEHRLKQAEHKLTARDKEHIDLQEAYKEKSRKCQAWEKAYYSLKQGGTVSSDIPSNRPFNGGLGGIGNVQNPSSTTTRPNLPIFKKGSNDGFLYNSGERSHAPIETFDHATQQNSNGYTVQFKGLHPGHSPSPFAEAMASRRTSAPNLTGVVSSCRDGNRRTPFAALGNNQRGVNMGIPQRPQFSMDRPEQSPLFRPQFTSQNPMNGVASNWNGTAQ